MCGRTRVSLAPERVLHTSGAARWVNQGLYQPSHNVSPGAATPVVVMDAQEGPLVHSMRWGLVPSFNKKEDKPDFWRMFNARSETVAEKPVFRRLVPTRRCLVLLDGFYEWKKEMGGVKQPYYIHLAGGEEPLVMAGLWDVWEGPEGPMETYTILTTDSSKRLEWLHDRMPVILRDKQAQQLWLDTQDKTAMGKLQQLCVPYNGEDLVWHPVTPKMNSPAFQGPECSKEIKKPSMHAFFQRRTPAAAPETAAEAAAAGDQGAAAAGHEQREQQQQQVQTQHGQGTAHTGAAVKKEEQEDEQQEQEAGTGIASKEKVGLSHSAAAPCPAGPAASIKEEPGGEQKQAGQQVTPFGATPDQQAAPAAINPDEQPPEGLPQRHAAGASVAGQQAQATGPDQTAAISPANLKRKQPSSDSGSGGGSKKGSGSTAKKQRPPGQPDIARFFQKN